MNLSSEQAQLAIGLAKKDFADNFLRWVGWQSLTSTEREGYLKEAAKRLATVYAVKDSGERVVYDTGFTRDTEEGKIDYTLLFDGPLAERYAAHLTKGAAKYGKRNWMQASTEEEAERFKRSASRHFKQWVGGETDEDHAAAVAFNVFAYEYVMEKVRSG